MNSKLWFWVLWTFGAMMIGVTIYAAFSSPDKYEGATVMQFVSGTEYNIGERAQVIVEARFANGSSALVDGCNMTIWYPDKSQFMLVSASSELNGNQYVNFTIPNVTGIYEYQASCSLLSGKNGVISKSFHVSEFQNETSSRLGHIKAVITP